MVLAPEQKGFNSTQEPPLHLQINMLQLLSALNHVPGEGLLSSAYSAKLKEYVSNIPQDTMKIARQLVLNQNADIHSLQVSHMIKEEHQLKSFTCRNLMKLANWDDWNVAFDSQLDAHAYAGTLGEPVL